MTEKTINPLKNSNLGKKTNYHSHYAPELLFPIPRQGNRDNINVSTPLPFFGTDIWNAYELSWLNDRGKPQVAIGEFIIPCTSPNIIESKSLKLYLNSLNNTCFANVMTVAKTIEQDLSKRIGAQVIVNIVLLSDINIIEINKFQGLCLDSLDVSIDEYNVNPTLLTTECETVSESLYSNLLKSNCSITQQPDWGSVRIQYTGPKIKHENLLKYIVSYRDHNEFHEPCVERMFMDISRQCAPQHLAVEARYTRRGGLDINPLRTTEKNFVHTNIRQWRQ